MKRRLTMVVESREHCPVRAMPDPEGGWGPQVPNCEHPERAARGGEPWCPERGRHRTDRSLDAEYGIGPFPKTCPLDVERGKEMPCDTDEG